MAKKTPTLVETKAYWQEQKVTSEAEAFFDHHLARGWIMSNGKKVKDWHAAARTWERNDAKFSRGGNFNGRPQETKEQARNRRNAETIDRYFAKQAAGNGGNIQ